MSNVDNNRNTLIALINSKLDLSIALKENWYRIPVKSKNAPPSVRNGTLKHIAFYQTKIFQDEAFKITWHSPVNNIEILKRHELFPDNKMNSKIFQEYYKIKFDKPIKLHQPIFSRRHRRILFINTTYERFKSACEINDLFLESPLEEVLWKRFLAEGIEAERQFFLPVNNKRFLLDFAIFCKRRNLAIECEGDSFHAIKVSQINNDKKRFNMIESSGWNVLRYSTYDILEECDTTVNQIKETINRFGGIQSSEYPDKYYYLTTKDFEQYNLFNESDIMPY